ncbi:TonB-dependent receptor domain-containing protein [Sandaracinobacter neustonicus]|nr:TonB-dependent receptor [Sandaracinobacter neustonicus]
MRIAKIRAVLICGAALIGLSAPAAAWAQARAFDVPAQPANRSIPEFARQAGIEIVAPGRALRGVTTTAIKGQYDTRTALDRLLEGTGLAVVADENGKITLAPAAARGAEEAALEYPEILVTATRRAVSVQEVPMAVTAIGEEQLERMGANGFADFYRSVPGLLFSEGDRNAGGFTIRGIASTGGDNQATVAVYLDELPTDDSRGARSVMDIDLFDVSRVEILRGPQGTLFGSGAMGGAVRVITNKPDTGAFSGKGQATLSTIHDGAENYELKGVLNVPLVAGRLALRTTGYYIHDGGFVDNVATGRKNANESRTYGGRASLRFEPSETLSLTATAILQDTDTPALGAVDRTPGAGYTWSVARPSYQNNRLQTYNFLGELELSFAQLMSSTTYAKKSGEMSASNDIVIFNSPDESESFAQEFRLTSNKNGPFSWVAGAFYLKRKREAFQTVIVPGFGEMLGFPTDTLIDATIWLDDQETALYGEATYEFSPSLALTGGLRWFSNTARYRDVQNGIATGLIPVANGPYSDTDRKVTPRLVLTYKPSSSAMIYASAAQGYRIGGVNVPIPIAPEVPAAYEPDSLWNYEIGAKTEWFDQRLIVNAALYYIDWTNIQIGLTEPMTEIGYMSNAGSAHSQGFELELTARPTKGLELASALSLNKAEFDETIPDTETIKGRRLPGQRKFTISNSIAYEFDLSDTTALSLRAEHQYLSDAEIIVGGETVVLPAHHLVNARATLKRGPINLTAFCQNLTNSSQFVSYSYRQKPRTIGLTLQGQF